MIFKKLYYKRGVLGKASKVAHDDTGLMSSVVEIFLLIL